jgi:Hemerythrin HHE cation binding domain
MAPRNATRSHPKDAIAMLHADHQKVRQLFRAYRTAKDQTTQWEIALHIFDELEVHAQLEEVVFYQAVEEETTSLGKRLVHAKSLHTRFVHSMSRTHCDYTLPCAASANSVNTSFTSVRS